MPSTAAELTPDLSMTKKFLRTLDRDATAFTFQTFADNDALKITEEFYSPADTARAQQGEKVKAKKRKVDPFAKIIHKPFDKASTALAKLNSEGAGVFVTVNEVDGKGRTIANFLRARAVWADLDAKSNADVDPEWPLAPSMVVESSPGNRHYYWLIEGHLSVGDHQGISERLVSDYGADRNACDIVRVLRLPGFYHRKGNPVLTKLIQCKGKRYTADQLMSAFPPIAKRVQKVKTAGGQVTAKLEDVRAALDHLCTLPVSGDQGAPSYVDDRREWIRFGLAIKRDFGDEGLPVWDEWSKQSPKYDEGDTHANWQSFDVDADADAMHVETIFKLAHAAEWRPSLSDGDMKTAYAQAVGAAKKAGLIGSKATVQALKAVTSTEHQASEQTNAETNNAPAYEEGVLDWAVGKAREMSATNRGWSDKEKEELLLRMNAEHAVVEYGGKVLYSKPGIDADNRPTTEFMSFDNMQKRYAAIPIIGSPQYAKNAFDVWQKWPGRKHHTGVGMFPGSTRNPARCPKDYLNLWGGLQLVPEKGDWSLVKTHMWKVICEGNDEAFNWWLDWMGQLIQKPQEKPPTSIVLRSSQRGTGKSMFGVFWREIFGRHVVPIANMEQITGRFNAAIAEAVLAMCEETMWGGARSDGNVLRERISGTSTTIERKGLDPITQPSFTRYWLNANDSWVVPAGIDERRFHVLDFSFERSHDPSYFRPIFKQMLAEGGVAAMAHELLERDVSETDLHCPPITKGLLVQRGLSLGGLHRWVRYVAENGEIDKSSEFQSVHILSETGDTEVPAGDVQEAAAQECDQFEKRGLQTSLGTLMTTLGITKHRRTVRQQRQYTYTFPPLAEFRTRVSKVLNLPIVASDHSDPADRL